MLIKYTERNKITLKHFEVNLFILAIYKCWKLLQIINKHKNVFEYIDELWKLFDIYNANLISLFLKKFLIMNMLIFIL